MSIKSSAISQGIYSGGNGKGDAQKSCSDISISSNPSREIKNYGINTSASNLSVSASSSNSISYQWYVSTSISYNGVSVGSVNGATTNTFTPSTNSVGTSYYYCMMIANGCATYSGISGAINVNCAQIDIQPSTIPQYLGLNVSPTNLSVTATAGNSIFYQWYKNKIASNAGGIPVSSGGVQSFYTPPTNSISRDYYYCTINISGCSPSLVSEVSGVVDVTYLQAFSGGNGKGDAQKSCSDVTIISNPSIEIKNYGINTTPSNLSVTASSSNIISYQWYSNTSIGYNGVSVGSTNGGNSNVFTPLTNTVGTKYYYCMMTSNGCSTFSGISGAINVNCAQIDVQPSTTPQYLGLNTSSTNLSISANAGNTISYQWYQSKTASNTGGVAVSSAGVQNIYTPPTNSISRDYYYCTINISGCSPSLVSEVSGVVDVTYLQAFSGGNGKGDAQQVGFFDPNGNWWMTNGSSDFSDISNWSDKMLPSTKPSYIPAGGTQPIVTSIDTIASLANLTVLSDAILKVVANSTLIVNGSLNNSGTITLQSNASGSGSIGNSSGTISGNITVERYIPSGRRAFRFLSHPFSSPIKLNQLMDDLHITGANGAAAGFDSTLLNNPSAFSFLESAYNGTNNSGWTAFTNASIGGNNINAYTPIRILYRGPRTQSNLLDGTNPTPLEGTLDWTGPINQGTITVPMTKTAGVNGGWNLLPNPYPSNYDLGNTASLDRNGISSFSVWVPGNGTRGAYSTHSFGSTYVLQSGAAFFVQTGSVANFTFRENQKTASDATASLLKTSPFDENAIKIDVLSDSIYWDKLEIRNRAFGTNELDMEDAPKMDNPDVNVFTYNGSNQKMAIDNRKIVNGIVIPIGFNVSSDYHFTFSFSNVNMKEYQIQLADNYLNKTIPITLNTKYNFSTNTDSKSKGLSRFALIFSAATGVEETGANLFVVYPNPVFDELYIKANGNMNQGTVKYTLYNTLGAVVQSGNIELGSGKISSINTSNLQNGVYFMELKSINEGSQTIKFVK